MADSDEFIGDGYQFRVIHIPGHSPGTTCLYESQQKILFSGDHIIKHITPNPLVEINRDRLQNLTYQSIKAYLSSHNKLVGLNVWRIYRGSARHNKLL